MIEANSSEERYKKSCRFSDISQKGEGTLNKIILFPIRKKCDKFLGGVSDYNCHKFQIIYVLLYFFFSLLTLQQVTILEI